MSLIFIEFIIVSFYPYLKLILEKRPQECQNKVEMASQPQDGGLEKNYLHMFVGIVVIDGKGDGKEGTPETKEK